MHLPCVCQCPYAPTTLAMHCSTLTTSSGDRAAGRPQSIGFRSVFDGRATVTVAARRDCGRRYLIPDTDTGVPPVPPGDREQNRTDENEREAWRQARDLLGGSTENRESESHLRRYRCVLDGWVGGVCRYRPVDCCEKCAALSGSGERRSNSRRRGLTGVV